MFEHRWSLTATATPYARPRLGRNLLRLGRARSLGAERDARRRREEVVERQQLDQRERLRAMEIGADRELAEPVGAEVAREVEAAPDHLLERPGALGIEAAGDAEMRLAVDLADPDARLRCLAVEHGAEVGVAESRPEDQLGVEPVLLRARRQERDDDVGVALLRADERLGVRFAAVELREHLVGRVAASRAVALHLPQPPQLLWGREEEPDVVEPAQLLGVVAEEAVDDGELLRVDTHERPEAAVLVPVDRLQERLARAQVREMLRHHVHVVALGMERCDVALGALLAVVAVVVVDADVRDVVLAQHPDEPACQGRLARGRVADDAERDRARAHAAPGIGPSSSGSRSSAKTLDLRMSSGVIVIRSSRLRMPVPSPKSRFACRSLARSIELRTLRPCANRGRVTRRSR